jgi:hypothetical protein
MHGVGPGSLVAGRYQLQRRIQVHPRWERWAADDVALDREVILLCFPAESPQAPATLDAARRAAGVEDPRLVRILDVGSAVGFVYAVEEPLTGARSLSVLLGNGGIPTEEARRIAGEAASALASADARGLHHGVLTPANILLMPDGSVKVRGLATEAALLGDDDIPSRVTARTDTRALVAVVYAALTGRWPLPGRDSGLAAAPLLGEHLVPPSEISAGVDPTLDQLTVQTLGGHGGPDSPAALAALLRPWSASTSLDLSGPPGRSTTQAPADTGSPGWGGGYTIGPRAIPPTLPEDAADTPVPGSSPSVGTAEHGSGDTGPDVAGVDKAGAGSAGAGSTGAGGSSAGTVGAATTTAAGGPSAPAGVAAAAGAGAVAAGAAVAKGLGTAATAVGAAAGNLAGRVGRAARATSARTEARAAERSAQVTARTAVQRPGRGLDDLFVGEDARLSDVLQVSDGRLEAPVPLISDERSLPPDRGQSKLALLIVAGFLLLAAIFGIWGLPKLGSPAAVTSSTSASSKAAGPAASPTTSAAPAPAQTGAALTAVAIVGAASLDSDGVQSPSASAPKAYDGDPATMWRSSKWYATENFGGYPVPGVGLILDLGQQTDVRRVALSLPAAQSGTVYVASEAKVAGAQPIGTFTDAQGTIVMDAPGGTPVKGQLVIVFVTKLGPDGEGHFRAMVAEIQVSR